MGSDDGHTMFINPCAEGDFIVRALHEYHTDSVGHLSFAQFQYIKVKHCEESGWWLGESENSRGWFPSNRVERVPAVYETEITSEDYDQIRTGLDGVETQFLGEPVVEPVSDSMQPEWGARSPPLSRTRAGQLAFPPSQLSASLSYHISCSTESSSADMQDGLIYSPTAASMSDVDTTDVAYAYSDFVTEVTVYVQELRGAVTHGEVDRYQPIVANIISCVKALLVFTNTIARDSEVLQAYSELAKSRRIILRALGKLYSKCRVANGSQPMTTARQRQFAADKLGFFECAAATTAKVGDLDMLLMGSAGDVSSSPPSVSSVSHSRPRRRVSRANSAKGYKSFNAVRQWKADHQFKHNVAKQAVELLLSEYMECLNETNETTLLDRILTAAIQTAQAVEIFMMSADDMKSRTASIKEDTADNVNYRAHLSAASNELYEYIKFLGSRGYSDENSLNKLMSLAQELLRCLVDMEPYSPGSRRASVAQKQESEMPKSSTATSTVISPFISSIVTEIPSINGQGDDQDSYPMETDEMSSKYTLSRSTATPRPKHPTSPMSTAPVNRKFASLNSLNERHKRQPGGAGAGAGGPPSPDGDVAHPNPEAVYSEGNDLERKRVESYRSNHDSAVVMSARATPHQSMVTPQMGTIMTIPIAEEAEESHMESPEPELPQDTRDKADKNVAGPEGVIKGAERKVAASIIMMTTEVSQIKEEAVVPTIPHSSRHRFEQDPDAPPTPQIRPQYISESSSSSLAGSKSPRMTGADADGTRSSRSPGRRGASSRNERARSPAAAAVLAETESDGIGLGVSVPTETRTRAPSPSAGSSTLPRSSRAATSRSPVPPSPRLEATRRTRQETRSHSPNTGADLRPFSRNSNNSSTGLSPAGIPLSRRGSQGSIRSDVSASRRSNDSQRVRDHDYQDRRQPSSQSGPRRGSNSGGTVRAEQQAKGDELLSGLSAPTMSQVQNFVDDLSNPQPLGKHSRRDSNQSNLSVGTECSVQSKASGRPVSPALRSRYGQHDGVSSGSSIKGRVSTDSTRSQHYPHQQPQQTKGASSGAYRPRQNKVGQVKVRASEENHKFETPFTTVTAAPGSWFLEYDYEADEVMYNENGTLVAATLDAYIEMLTSHKNTPEP
ncbi:hypothetical protein BGZ65_004430, partial [Modicella reniformis]